MPILFATTDKFTKIIKNTKKFAVASAFLLSLTLATACNNNTNENQISSESSLSSSDTIASSENNTSNDITSNSSENSSETSETSSEIVSSETIDTNPEIVTIPDTSVSTSNTTNGSADASGEVSDMTVSNPETSILFPSDDVIDNTNDIVSTAETLIGIPFADGGTSPETGFDNSGFIYYVLRQNGYINTPRMTSEQATMGTNIPAESLQAGDLVFFSNDGSSKADFGGIYAGGGQMIYCPMPGQTVKYVDITTDYWRSCFICAVSLN